MQKLDDLLLRGARSAEGARVDIVIRGEHISQVTPTQEPGPRASEIIELEGALVLPGLVDGHIHLDKTLLGAGWIPHVRVSSRPERIALEKRVLAELPISLEERASRLMRQVVAHGSTHLRCHVDIDTDAGLSRLHVLASLRERYRAFLDVELVAFPQSGVMIRPGTLDLLDAALAEGADLVGGLDPAGMDGDITGQLDGIFAIATRRGVRIDIHLHDPGQLGLHQIHEITRRTRAHGLAGRVAISHAYCLGQVGRDEVERAADALAETGVAVMTNGPGGDTIPPLRPLRERGVALFAGSDNIRDAWWPFGNGDMLERAMLIAYRSDFFTDDELAFALEMATTGAARVMGIDGYGLRSGARADLVIVRAGSVAEAVVERPPREMVIKAGRIVARGGALVGWPS